MQSHARVLVLGSLNLDLVMRVARMPEAGETLASESSATFCGGKGANQAVACARMGADVSMIGCLGADPAGDMLRSALVAEGVTIEGVRNAADTGSGSAVILLTRDGQNRILIAAGANALLSPADVEANAARLDAADILVCQLETPLETVLAAAKLASAKSLPMLLNPAPARELPDELLRDLAFLIPNETEASMLTSIKVTDVKSATDAALALRARGVRCVIVTLGANGILIADKCGVREMPALPAKVVDTTAAGDSFIGGFATGIAEGLDLDDAARLGLRVARLCVGREGAQASLPRRAEIEI